MRTVDGLSLEPNQEQQAAIVYKSAEAEGSEVESIFRLPNSTALSYTLRTVNGHHFTVQGLGTPQQSVQYVETYIKRQFRNKVFLQ